MAEPERSEDRLVLRPVSRHVGEIMAVVGHLHKVVFGGRLAITESWSCSFHWLNPDPGNLVISGLFASGVSQWFQRVNSGCSALAFLDYIKINELNPLSIPSSVPGKPASKPFTRYLSDTDVNEYAMPTPAAGPLPSGPVQVTYAASTLTGFLRGPAHQGRFYPPLGHYAVGADGRLAASTALGMSVSAAQLVTDMNGAVPGSAVVYSGVNQTTRQITAVRVGRVADTQRRRRRSLVEDYQQTPVS